jgi:UDP-galactopyranose mutase
VLVVGAGFAGSVIAERFASSGKSVLVIDRRPHIGGNAFDEYDTCGVLVHRYGPHIFHTNSTVVSEYLSRFTAWRQYEHRVLSFVDGTLYPMPINRTTINQYFGLELTDEEVEAFLAKVGEKRSPVCNSEDLVLNSVGRELCDKFFRNYTRKQWNLDLSELSPAVAGRVPVRTNSDDRYFTDSFQKMPSEGFTKMFERMLDHANIRVELGTAFEDIKQRIRAGRIFYSGPIDAYFDFCFGKLPYRSLQFQHEHLPGVQQYQRVGTVNYPNDHAFTRITEFKHLTGQRHSGTSIVREFPQAEGDPYYPVPTKENQTRYEMYSRLVESQRNVFFIGRLAEYRYYNMDQVVAAALRCFSKFQGPQ